MRSNCNAVCGMEPAFCVPSRPLGTLLGALWAGRELSAFLRAIAFFRDVTWYFMGSVGKVRLCVELRSRNLRVLPNVLTN